MLVQSFFSLRKCRTHTETLGRKKRVSLISWEGASPEPGLSAPRGSQAGSSGGAIAIAMPAANCSAPSAAVEVTVGALLALECAPGLLGNAVALWTFCFRLKVWKPYAVYLLNLVAADLLLTFCQPFHAAFYLRRKTWPWGRASCQTLLFLHVLSRGVGVAFLAAVALDRYFRVVHPRLKVNLLSLRVAWGVSGFVWLLLLGLTHQSLFVSEAACPGPEPRGGASLSLLWQEALSFLQFILPFGLILFCNAGVIRTLQRRLREPDRQPKLQRARALVTVALVLFALCFLPSFLARVLVAVFRGTGGCGVLGAMVHVSDVANGLSYLQSVLNPVLYCFSNPVFRCSYRKVFNTLRGRGRETEAPGDIRDSYS
ncbi:LOW QUALITY PROTEIN: 12-(S)-hydroxy-5,8,10,14-eicosatetraenoic acid receptor-like [Enhydra lutris kenyoni]|uniref:LOW QUALITY PROTEIN: 12-(S)-hydroxy-5,8,10,14-eicosatetraenoic acid receptor-like n=1 Tax=Enhydra lutris kenyoni TaxID=391180 RepID=A0A2Y9KU46_ENHLU|nr:LOW QUALITY PROTEIN: 12-(S)-hydroxy-5,8,10,14-eicosatetraenoic acid receptor-like [Enhydra lutris kenyoni]XP_022376673.1 LOW QUALITY PROTEIN: 12-(S)-hydroxy-5,8,10,14-eicosatetraenoic acid receptor-like [Enhydra lutris kenyoni]